MSYAQSSERFPGGIPTCFVVLFLQTDQSPLRTWLADDVHYTDDDQHMAMLAVYMWPPVMYSLCSARLDHADSRHRPATARTGVLHLTIWKAQSSVAEVHKRAWQPTACSPKQTRDWACTRTSTAGEDTARLLHACM